MNILSVNKYFLQLKNIIIFVNLVACKTLVMVCEMYTVFMQNSAGVVTQQMLGSVTIGTKSKLVSGYCSVWLDAVVTKLSCEKWIIIEINQNVSSND